MNSIANTIRNRLSLRAPQEKSLYILADLVEKLLLKKDADLGAELEKVKTAHPTCIDFERNFPSICFSLATGVGKTRLMGAFITYLYLAKRIKNFFVLAPNLTIYNKLIGDFSDPSNPKYVFRGIGEFVNNQPRVVTGDNYQYTSDIATFNSEIHINVFNISKINAETRGNKEPRIKRLSECLGWSYFNYLSHLDDLVLLMDESHHYRADRGMQVINELNPILGLELTATPQVERSGGAIKFKNVVYEYSLAKAIQDGFVKEPAVATRRDFDPTHYSAEDLDRIKLEDGVRIHEDTKVALDIYARDNKVKQVKPFVLVVAKDTTHAGAIKKLIASSAFFDGYYADKVMEIHSSQTGSEKEENIAQLISLENPGNPIEIVIHVNMLKEGWDVTNLYTIVPLRTAASMTLREQTIGRGLRLPYGQRTGHNKVDKLTIVAHDKFQEIIDEANKPDSIIRRENIIEIDEQEISQRKEVITSVSNIEVKLEEERKRIENISQPEQRQKAQINLEVQKKILETLPKLNDKVNNINELTKEEIKQIAVEKIREKIYSETQQLLFAEEIVKEAEAAYETVVADYIQNMIEIPRIMIQPSARTRAGFHDFDLDTRNLNYQPVSEEILRKTLREQEEGLDIITGRGRIISGSPEHVIVNELIDYSEINYDAQADLLFKLAGQAVEKFKTYLDEDTVANNVVPAHKKEIGRYIYSQMKQHFYCERIGFEKPIVKPFTKIEEHNFSKDTQDSIYHYTQTITPTRDIPRKIFTGFTKACHRFYKFESKPEKDFAVILEQDKSVLKWLRPAPNQFRIYWKPTNQYHPDFVAESKDTIYLIETKREATIDSAEVEGKARAALEYCRYATEFTTQHEGKPWKYILIPANTVMTNMSFDTMVRCYEYRKNDEN